MNFLESVDAPDTDECVSVVAMPHSCSTEGLEVTSLVDYVLGVLLVGVTAHNPVLFSRQQRNH